MKKENKKEVEVDMEEISTEQSSQEQSEPEDERLSLGIIEYHREMSTKKKVIISVSIFVVIVGGGLASYFLDQKGFFDQYKETKEDSIENLKEATVDARSSESLPEAVKKEKESSNKKDDSNEVNKKIEILVLNGGGASGSAGEMKSFLNKNEYNNAKVDNASSYNYSGVTIYYKSDDYKKDAKILKELIDEKYKNVDTKKASTAGEKVSEIVIVIGK
ncbi:LytR C-terminal domain-containing protein [Patescibacteria group bacterium]